MTTLTRAHTRPHRLPPRRRRVALALVAVLALAVAGTGFSGASFTQASHGGASLAAGTVGLTLSRSGQSLLSSSGLSPGSTVGGSETLTSSGSLPTTVRVSAAGLADVPSASGLSGVLVVTFTDHASGAQLWSGTLAALASGGASLGTLNAGAARTIDLSRSWPSSARNATLQGATTSFSFQWRATS
jgi:hypothetical protein